MESGPRAPRLAGSCGWLTLECGALPRQREAKRASFAHVDVDNRAPPRELRDISVIYLQFLRACNLTLVYRPFLGSEMANSQDCFPFS